jgi:hypothetical protein
MVSPLSETILTPPQTAPAATGRLQHLSRPPTRGTLALPNRGFRGTFITRSGRVLTPADMAGAVERLSHTGHSFDDLQQVLQQLAHLPRQKTCLGKEFITTAEVRSYTVICVTQCGGLSTVTMHQCNMFAVGILAVAHMAAALDGCECTEKALMWSEFHVTTTCARDVFSLCC